MVGEFIYRFLILIGLGYFLLMHFGCEEVIDLDGGPPNNELVIYGKMTDSKSSFEVRVSRATTIGEASIPVDGAIVQVFDQDNTVEEAEAMGNGIYMFRGNIVCGIPGNSYYVVVTLADGTTYQSIPETMPLVSASDSSYANVVTEEVLSDAGVTISRTFIKVFVDTKLPINSSIYLKWDVHQVYPFQTAILPPAKYPLYSQTTCYFLEFTDTQKLNLFSSDDLNISEINEQLLNETDINDKFYNRHYFNVVQSSISFQAHRYWNHIDQIANRTGSIFDTPPAKVLGNFYNVNDPNEEVLGYFEVAKMDTSRSYITRENIPFFIPNPCPPLDPLVYTGFEFRDYDTLKNYYGPECYLWCGFHNEEAVIPMPDYFDD